MARLDQAALASVIERLVATFNNEYQQVVAGRAAAINVMPDESKQRVELIKAETQNEENFNAMRTSINDFITSTEGVIDYGKKLSVREIDSIVPIDVNKVEQVDCSAIPTF